MRLLVLGLLAIGVGEVYSSPVLGGWGKQDGSGLLGKVANLSHTVYERKREFLNGVNEKVSRMLWIPPWTTTTTARPLPTTTTEAPREVPNADTPNIWWWQTSAKPRKSSTEPTIIQSTTSKVLLDEDRLMFTVADTNQLELPNVSMYARSVFIPEELRLTADSDAVEFVEPTIFGRGPPADPDRLIMH